MHLYPLLSSVFEQLCILKSFKNIKLKHQKCRTFNKNKQELFFQDNQAPRSHQCVLTIIHWVLVYQNHLTLLLLDSTWDNCTQVNTTVKTCVRLCMVCVRGCVFSRISLCLCVSTGDWLLFHMSNRVFWFVGPSCLSSMRFTDRRRISAHVGTHAAPHTN